MTPSELRFLADESCDFAVVRALRAEGYDVLAISEKTSRSVDSDLIAQAAAEKRIVLTEDKDFGRLVHVDALESAGVFSSVTRGTRGGSWWMQWLSSSVSTVMH